MPSMQLRRDDVIVGVDTHKDNHVAVAIDGLGGRLGDIVVPTTIAGFEGGTKIYLNTIDPQTLRDIVTADLLRLREQGAIADTLRIGPECARVPNSLRYNPAVRRTPRPDAAFPSLYGPG